MPSGLLIKLRPAGPWRIGPDSGVRDRVDRIYHSDSLYSAVCWAMAQLGKLDDWLDATARSSDPVVRLGSCYPFVGDTLFVPPPQNVWPPPASSKVRWKGATFVPMSAVETLLAGRPLSEDGFQVDGESQCLLPQRTPPVQGPYRVGIRSSAAVDRAGEAVTPHATACLEFAPGAGLWTVAQFAPSVVDVARRRWKEPITAAFKLLADSGFGGERSRGWGRAEQPEIVEGELPHVLGLRTPRKPSDAAYWLLSLFHPASDDTVDWERGNYSLTTRGGRTESAAGWGEPKQLLRLVTEGSVLVASREPNGAAADVAPEGFAHPVYRAGFALSIPIPLKPETKAPGGQS